MGQINELLEDSLQQLKKMMEANNVIGEPLMYNDITIIPVTSIHLGFLSGGSDIKANPKDEPLFGGATSGGVGIEPNGFLIIKDNDVSFIAIDNQTHIYEKIIDYLAKALNKSKTLFENNVEIKEI